MKVTKLDDGTLHIDMPEALSVSSALAEEARTTGSPLGFQVQHEDAVRLALLIATIPAPDSMDPHVAVPRALFEELVEGTVWAYDAATGTEAKRWEQTIQQGKALLR